MGLEDVGVETTSEPINRRQRLHADQRKVNIRLWGRCRSTPVHSHGCSTGMVCRHERITAAVLEIQAEFANCSLGDIHGTQMVARAGLDEQHLVDRGIPYEVTRYEFADSDRAIAEGHTSGFVKLFTKKRSDQLLGACLVGAHAGDLIQGCIDSMTHGYGLNRVLSTLHVYPTRSEAFRLAAGNSSQTTHAETIGQYCEAPQ